MNEMNTTEQFTSLITKKGDDKRLKLIGDTSHVVSTFIDELGLMRYATNEARDKFMREATLLLTPQMKQIVQDQAFGELVKLLSHLLADAQSGISLNPSHNHIYIERRISNNEATYNRQYQYKGLIVLMSNAGYAITSSAVVYQQDEWDVDMGTNARIYHKPNMTAQINYPIYGKINGEKEEMLHMNDALFSFAVAKHRQTGAESFKICREKRFLDALNKSTKYSWRTHTVGMMIKTPIRDLAAHIQGTDIAEDYEEIERPKAYLPPPALPLERPKIEIVTNPQLNSPATDLPSPIIESIAAQLLTHNNLADYDIKKVADYVIVDGQIDKAKLEYTIAKLKERKQDNAK
jgi:hypothetical protein